MVWCRVLIYDQVKRAILGDSTNDCSHGQYEFPNIILYNKYIRSLAVTAEVP